MKLINFTGLAFIGLLAGAANAWAETVTVAVAANFTAPMRQLAAAFEQETGHRTILSFGSSGKFFAQIKNGAPFQVFLSADEQKPAQLEQDGFTLPATRFTYALGRLVLWSANPQLIAEPDGADILKSANFKHLALANPKLAPYGAAAIETLKSLHVYPALEPKFVTGENVSQTYQFIASGNAELGFIALSQVIADGQISQGSAWIVPTTLHQPIRQDAVALATGKDNPAVDALMEYLRSDQAGAIIKAFGYQR